jgi:uncharacterized protein (TIGR02246 family)
MSDSSLQNDLRAIQALNQRHIEAWLSSDTEAVIALWSDDFTVIPPAGPIVRGRRANAEILEKGMEQILAFEPLEAVEDFEEIKIIGDYAFQWGTYRFSSRPRAGGDSVSSSGRLLRILQRQSDGSWKMYRTIATIDPPRA